MGERPATRPRGEKALDLDRPDLCYLTTTGRVTGRSHRIEIWFAHRDRTVYFLSGGGDRADWVRNLLRDPVVKVRIGRRSYSGRGRVVSDPHEKRLAREALFRKYRERYADDLAGWRDASLPVAVDLGL